MWRRSTGCSAPQVDEIAAAGDALARFVATYPTIMPPVDVEELAASLCRLRVRRGRDLAAVAGGACDGPLSGLLLPARSEIWVRSDEPADRRRFTVAHEIGHHLLHADRGSVLCRPADLGDADGDTRARERQANRFAAELLMPERLVRELAAGRGADPIALAAKFAVSDVAMGFRLVNLGYLEALPADLEARRRPWQEGAG